MTSHFTDPDWLARNRRGRARRLLYRANTGYIGTPDTDEAAHRRERALLGIARREFCESGAEPLDEAFGPPAKT